MSAVLQEASPHLTPCFKFKVWVLTITLSSQAPDIRRRDLVSQSKLHSQSFHRTKTMLAWRKHLGNTSPIREEVPIPTAPANGFLVKVLAAGVCHSDCALLAMTTTLPNFDEKYTLGHEGCGEIVEIGSDVTDLRLRKGDLVAVLAVPGCGQSSCLECRNGLPQLCKNAACHGIGQDGSFASYVAINRRAAIPVPDGVTPAQAAVATDACLTAYHAVKRVADVKSGDTVLIFGLGGLGFNALQIVLSIGARLLVVDKRPEVLEEAVKFGVAKEDVAPVGEDIALWVKSRGLAVDTVIDFVGVNDTYTASQHLREYSTHCRSLECGH